MSDAPPTPPHSVEAEQGVLSSMMQPHGGNEAIVKVVEKLSAESFYIPAHKTIFDVLIDFHDAGKAIDLITLTQALRDRNLIDSVGGAAAVTNLFTFVPSPANVGNYIDIVREKYILRSIISTGTESVRRAYESQTEPEEILSFAAKNFDRLHGRNGSNNPVIEDAAALLAEPIKLPPDVIEGVLHGAGKMVVGGATKTRKTWLLIDLGVSVATGAAWLNGYPTKKGRVLYVNFELPKAYCAKRIATICDERQLRLEPHMLDVWNLRGHASKWPRLQAQIPADTYVLVVVDPSYKLLHGRDENKAGDIAGLLDEFEVLAVRTGAAVAFGAHYSKGNQASKESIDRIGGSGVFVRDPDSILNFTRHKEPDCFTVEMTLRNHPPREPFVVRWEYPLFKLDDLLDPTQLKQAGRKPDEDLSAAKILELLSEPMTATDWLKACVDELGVSRATFFRRKEDLERGKKIAKRGDGKWTRVS